MRGTSAANRWVAHLACLIAAGVATSTHARAWAALPLAAQVVSVSQAPVASVSTPKKMAATFESARQQARQVKEALRRR